MKQFNMVLRRNTKAFFGGALALMSTLFAFNADAQTSITSTFSVVNAGSPTATTTCVIGDFASNWQTPGTGFWQYTLNTTGFANVTMTFKNEKSSAAGPTLGSIWYNTGSGVDTLLSSFIPSTSCPTSFTVVNLPFSCWNNPTLTVKVKMTGATANTATHRITAAPFAGTSTACSTLPAAGSVTGNGTICAGTSATLTLSSASGGGGITYQWQSSPDSITWSNIAGATGLTFATPTTLTDTIYYRVQVTCPAAGSTFTAGVKEIINTIHFGAITGLDSSLMIVGTKDTITTTPSGGLWQSSNTSRATIDASGGFISANAGGAVTFSYSVVSGITGCVGTKDTTLNIVWPNTLALYAGDSGTTTHVITVPNEGTVNNLVATGGFGSSTICASGGLSGLTVPTTVTSWAATNPHVGFEIYATPGHALNLSRIHATTRESATGPTRAIIAYRVAGSATWVTEDTANVQTTGASCGTASNSWDFEPSLTLLGQDSVEIAVFPYASSSSAGTFQLNSLEVYGIVSDTTPCSGLSHPGALDAPTKWIICDTGSRWLNYSLAGAGAGISLKWQKSSDGVHFFDIVPAATTASYNTGLLDAGNPADTFNVYRVKLTCSVNGDSAFTAPDTILVHGRPIIGTIVSAPNVLFPNFLHDGDMANLSVSPSGSLTFWSSNDTSAVAVDSAFGVVTGRIPGLAFITAHTTNDGVCFSTTTATIQNIEPLSVAVYVGQSGTSTSTTGISGVSIASPVSISSGFGSTATCSFGGVSGMALPAGITSYNSSNPFVSMTIQADPTGLGFEVDGIVATLRASASGPHFARIIYSINGGAFQTDGTDQSVDVQDCGKSATLLLYSFSTNPTLNAGDSIVVRIYPFYGAGDPTGGAFQVNTLGVISGTAASTLQHPAVAVAGAIQAQTVTLFPNPATNVLNVAATQAVNVTILSADGKKVIEQNNAKQINISGLATGLYLVQVSDAKGNLIETTKFIKQ